MLILAAAKAKILYVVLIAYCSIQVHGACGLAMGHTTYKTRAACEKVAKKLDKRTLEELLSRSDTPPPWDVKPVCGTTKQGEQTLAALLQWKTEKDLYDNNKPEPHQEQPGDRDPFPDGG